MVRCILFTLLSVFLLTFIGELFYGYAETIRYLDVNISDTGLTVNIINFLFSNIRWEYITSNLFVSAFTILLCIKNLNHLTK